MFNSASLAVVQKGLKNLQVIEITLLLAVSIVIQFFIHLIPPVEGLPLGQILLPAFYAPLFALMFFRMHVALTTAILTPMINYLITGFPRPEILPLLTIELVIFVVIAYFILQNKNVQLISAMTAVVFAKIVSAVIMPLIFTGYAGGLLFQSLIVAVPGILILSVLNILLLRYKNSNG
ncbi:MAG: hypothetical protein R6W90_01965 [Ignavibacteriaceae bacterium]